MKIEHTTYKKRCDRKVSIREIQEGDVFTITRWAISNPCYIWKGRRYNLDLWKNDTEGKYPFDTVNGWKAKQTDNPDVIATIIDPHLYLHIMEEIRNKFP